MNDICNIDNLQNKSSEERFMFYRDFYRVWKHYALSQYGYFIIFQGFDESNKLKNISGNALKLYIYLGLHANNYEGVVWHSNKKIANYFNKSERTIRAWMKELEDLKLIKRIRMEFDGNVYTHLIPYEVKEDFRKIEEGRLYFNDKGQLCFQGENKSFVLREEHYIMGLLMDSNQEVIGHLIKKQYEDKEWYEFKSQNNKYIISINFEKYKNKIISAVLYYYGSYDVKTEIEDLNIF